MNDFKNVTRLSGGETIERLLEACNHDAVVGICQAGDTIIIRTLFPDDTCSDNQVALVAGETFAQKHSDIGESVRCMD